MSYQDNHCGVVLVLFRGAVGVFYSPSQLGKVLYNCGMIFFILSFFVGYILSFGLVKLRTIWLSARAGTHIECRCSRSCRKDETITGVIIKTPDRNGDCGFEWRHARKRWAEDLGWFLKKGVSWDLNREKASWFSNLDEASPVVRYVIRRALLGRMEQSA